MLTAMSVPMPVSGAAEKERDCGTRCTNCIRIDKYKDACAPGSWALPFWAGVTEDARELVEGVKKANEVVEIKFCGGFA